MSGLSQQLLKKLEAYRPHWNWNEMLGSSACLKWGFRDLQNVDAAIEFCRMRRACVQAGGNIGLFPKRLAESFERVITFEPEINLYMQLCKNTPEANVQREHAALGDSREGVAMRCSRRDDSGRAVHEGLTHVSGPGSVRQVMVDDLQLADCDLIYLDVEGYELKALRGALQTIERCRPVIGVELNRNINYYGDSADEVRTLILHQGYRLVLAQHSDEIYAPI